MKILDYEQNSDEWFEARKGKITGSKLKDIVVAAPVTKEMVTKELKRLEVAYKGNDKVDNLLALLPKDSIETLKEKAIKSANKKVGFYQLIADRVFDSAPSEEDDRERGHSLEEEAAERFELETGKVLRRVGILVSDTNPNIAVSPDRVVEADRITEHVEIKCLGDARHVEAVINDSVPADYFPQVIQNFIVNDDCQTVYLVFYSDRTQIPKFQFHVVKISRKEVETEIDFYRSYQENTLKEVNELLEQYVF